MFGKCEPRIIANSAWLTMFDLYRGMILVFWGVWPGKKAEKGDFGFHWWVSLILK